MTDTAPSAAVPARGHAGGTPNAPEVEAAALAVGFGTALRRAGLPTPPDRAAWLAQALRLVPPSARDRLYWASRVTLVQSREQLPVFDAVFAAVFDGLLDPAEHRGEPTNPPVTGSEVRTRTAPPEHRRGATGVSAPARQTPAAAPGGDRHSEGPERDAVLAMASADEALHGTHFAQLSPEEMVRVRALVRQLVLATPARRSRRTRKARHGNAALDMRRTIRAARRAGGQGGALVYARRRARPRPLVFLCDVSASMEPYTQIFLTLIQGAVAGAGAEAFVFSTRLTRLTRQLSAGNPDVALARASAAATDWAGGTRLAESLRRFIDDHGRRGLARGAVVVVLSDGWAQDTPDEVAAQMARLRRLAYRIIWVNPRKAGPGYQPLVGGMAAALPYCDEFVSGHSYGSLSQLAAAIRDGP
ncbi:vWA domain-containing protein [Arthrobacter wenxiniae]|uniref:VWA domain-containing protein n=1 Tax=Arthrobacter wenxiniae TaxID=2713570 RepID=A0A7Y7LZX1_9MICC|nr:VWA domain-containing protein [Arthrobacter wenxiniae]NVM96442.1 VWA domain-containing protein [Arthrobacter wenxiniae]